MAEDAIRPDVPQWLRVLLFLSTAAAILAWYMLLQASHLLPGLDASYRWYYDGHALGWSALIFGWAFVGRLNAVIRRWLENQTADRGLPEEEAALRRRDRFVRRVRYNRRWWWLGLKPRLQKLTAAEFMTLERRRPIAHWLTAFGCWLMSVGAQRPELASYEGPAFWSGFFLLAIVTPMTMTGLGKGGAVGTA